MLSIARLDQPILSPVPPGTPNHDLGRRPFAGTGPYELVAGRGGTIPFVRNPFFREWSHAAQPEGKPDEILFTPRTDRVRAFLKRYNDRYRI